MLSYIWSARTEYVGPHLIHHDTFLLSWAAKWHGQKKTMSAVLTPDEAVGQDDARIVQQLADLVREADIVVAHNGDKFDVKKLNARLLLLQQEPLGPVRTIDTCMLSKRTFSLASNSLGYLARALGVRQKMDTGGFDLWHRCYMGDEKALRKMDRYCRQDVRALEDVFDAMRPYVKGLPRLVDADAAFERACPSCGSDQLQSRGLARTNASTFRRFQCQECGRWSRARTGQKDKRLATVPL